MRARILTPLAGAAILAGALLTGAGALRSAGASSVNGDHHSIATLEARLAADGVRAQHLVKRYNAAESEVQRTTAQLASTRHTLAAERAQSAAQTTRLRTVAVAAYVDAGTIADNPLLAGPSSSADAASVYASVAANRLDSAITGYKDAQHRVSVTAATLQQEQQAAEKAAHRLGPASAAAARAVAQDNALLTGVKANLAHLVLVAQQRHAAEVAAAERALARRAAQVARRAAARRAAEIAAAAPAGGLASHALAHPKTHKALATTTQPEPSAPQSGGGYANPFRAAVALSPERIDQGVDFGGAGPIYAIGDGRVLSTVNWGWPGGTFIAYELTDGPAAGLIVYAAEDISPQVSVGETITPATVIGTMYGGPDGIETGWASGSSGDTMAMVDGQYGGANSTAFGLNFSQLLQSLGSPGGVLQGGAYGSLPAGWPTW